MSNLKKNRSYALKYGEGQQYSSNVKSGMYLMVYLESCVACLLWVDKPYMIYFYVVLSMNVFHYWYV